ncbi:RDD family protein [Streptomyces sp. NBC_00338]|uniref:RDD family protein n=1 Tax=Streptomyces sp. NBC_00338 TaxID=2975715 RepID=UPI002B1E7058|nr:RDD family protein [Streptomyces sp. NBC_00338]
MTTSRGHRSGRVPHTPYGPPPLTEGPRLGYGYPGPSYGAGRTGPRTPPRAGEMRRYLAVGLDCYLCLVVSGLLVRPHVDSATVPQVAGLLVGPVLVLSFLNQVVLTALVGAGAGKLIMGIRVVSLPDVGRPGPGRLVRRWLYGLCWLPLQPWYGVRAHLARSGGEGGPGHRAGHEENVAHPDPAGLRQVRRSDLAAHRRAVAGRTV